ncbi:MAG: hypothetical protein RLN72_09735 [Henriciella sp.]
MSAFADRLIAATEKFGPLCVGIDPHRGRIPAIFGGDTAEGIERWGLAMVDAIMGRAGVIKPQIAFFERHGWRGLKALEHICATAREAGLVVLMVQERRYRLDG